MITIVFTGQRDVASFLLLPFGVGMKRTCARVIFVLFMEWDNLNGVWLNYDDVSTSFD